MDGPAKVTTILIRGVLQGGVRNARHIAVPETKADTEPTGSK